MFDIFLMWLLSEDTTIKNTCNTSKWYNSKVIHIYLCHCRCLTDIWGLCSTAMKTGRETSASLHAGLWSAVFMVHRLTYHSTNVLHLALLHVSPALRGQSSPPAFQFKGEGRGLESIGHCGNPAPA